MSAAEQMYFDGAPLAHVVAWEYDRRARRQAEIAKRSLRTVADVNRAGSRPFSTAWDGSLCL